MAIFVLMKGLDEKPTFHGITDNETAAETWDSGSDENWYEGFDDSDTGYHDVSAEPIVYTTSHDLAGEEG
jgi:hypothetical protein